MNRLLPRLACVAALLMCSVAAPAAELPDPLSLAEAPVPPRLLADPARPANAPTIEAIDSLAREDGAAASVTLATRALEASRIAYGPRDARTVIPLINLATARQRAGQPEAALRDYRAAIDLAESTGGPRAAHLHEAWYGLAYTTFAAGEPVPAGEAFETALQHNRVNEGLFSPRQLEMLHALALTRLDGGRGDEANDLQQRRAEMAEQIHGVGMAGTAQTYVAVGRWYRAQGRFDDALPYHLAAVQILERLARNDPRNVDALLELTLTASGRRRDPDEAQLPLSLTPASTLARAERLVDEAATLDAATRAAAYTRVADVHQTLARPQAAQKLYAKALALMNAEQRAQAFSEPRFLVLRRPQIDTVPGAGGVLVAEFEVNAKGRTENIRLVEKQPASLPDSAAGPLLSALRGAVLRPRLVDGKPVATKAARYRLRVRGDSA